MMQERRANRRNRAFVAGRIAYGDRRSTLACVVRDISETGALLLVDEPLRAPCHLDLTIPASGESLRARVVWRGETSVGVAFALADIDAPSPGPCQVVSLAEVRAARSPIVVRDRLAERMAQVSRPAPREHPAWAWPVVDR